MIRRGVAQKTACTVSGHKTDAVFSRYNIVSDADLLDADVKIEAGAKAAVSGVTQSLLIVEPESDSAADGKKGQKPF